MVFRGLTYYWRTNLAVVAGVATAVGVLAGALVVGDSVRSSLRDLVLARLGATDQIVVSTGFFREGLAADLAGHEDFGPVFDRTSPLVMAQALVTEQAGGNRVGQVLVYGVDDRFWRFHGVSGLAGPAPREAFVSPALARDLNADVGGAILVRVQRPSEIPLESLFGDKDDLSRSLRLTVRAVVPPDDLGEFSLSPSQGEIRAVFVPLADLQRDLETEGLVNALLVSARPDAPDGAVAVLERLVRTGTDLSDLGLHVRALDARHALSVEADGGLLSDAQVSAAREAETGLELESTAVFTYLANALRHGDRDVPYSLVAAVDVSTLDLETIGDAATRSSVVSGFSRTADRADTAPPILLNEWAARELAAGEGDSVTMEYFVWEDPGRLLTRTAEFRVAGIVPINPADRDLAPTYPGISDSPTLDDWNPPFPVDLRRVRPVDEAYWETYRTTPKAYIPIDIGQRLWRSRYGATTSLRITVEGSRSLEDVRAEYASRLRARIDPLAGSFAVRDVRAEGLEASQGATDFGEYFVYFSFFLVVSALLLAALFFKLSVEQRAREIGLLRAVGYGPSRVRRLFLSEGLVLSLVGSVLGMAGAVVYAELMMAGLRTWWVDAVGTTALTLHLSGTSLVGGALGGVAAALACIWATLRSLSTLSERRLLAGQLTPDVSRAAGAGAGRRYALAAGGFALLGAALLAATMGGLVGRTGAFFGAGSALLVACLLLFALRLRQPGRDIVAGRGLVPVTRLGARNTTHRPGRSVLAITVVASATFMLVSVDAFRREAEVDGAARDSGVGGYTLMVDSLLPIVHDPGTSAGRAALGIEALDRLADGGSIGFEPFRVLPGDDASCLNLYRPQNPRILAPRDAFRQQGRFRFGATLASTDAERRNPWLLLDRDDPDGAVPVIADANSMTYVLHRSLGEAFELTSGDRSIRVRIVAALDDSLFQGELLMSERHFLALFPAQAGSRFLLVDTSPGDIEEVSAVIEDALADLGADVTPTVERLAEFHRVENTYLSTFQTLGGLGLMLGTFGLGAVLLRNVLERRRELALLRALGYKPWHFLVMVVAENALLLTAGLVAGTVCAGLAIAPALWDRGGPQSLLSPALLLVGVLVVGLLASVGATIAALRTPLLAALRAE